MLSEAVAVVTGGGRGIGRSIVDALVAEGARVVTIDVIARDDVARDERVTELSGDVGNLADLDALIAHIERGGRLDVLVNNAADVLLKPVQSASVAEFQRILDVNVRAYWYLAIGLAPLLARSSVASIVNVASTHPLQTKRASFPYNMSKGAVLALTKALAVDLGELGVRVNSVLPGIVDTTSTRAWLATMPNAAQVRQNLTEAQPLGRLPTPSEVANAVAFLASPSSSGISGTDLVVDAGRQAFRKS